MTYYSKFCIVANYIQTLILAAIIYVCFIHYWNWIGNIKFKEGRSGSEPTKSAMIWRSYHLVKLKKMKPILSTNCSGNEHLADAAAYEHDDISSQDRDIFLPTDLKTFQQFSLRSHCILNKTKWISNQKPSPSNKAYLRSYETNFWFLQNYKRVNWLKSGDPVSTEIRYILTHKTKPILVIFDGCVSEGFMDYLIKLQKNLLPYTIKIDLFGSLVRKKCLDEGCEDTIKHDYYFNFIFDKPSANISEKVLRAYTNYAVPIVYGSTNYSRYLPKGSFINARELHPYAVAYQIYQVIKYPKSFVKYFNWIGDYMAPVLKI